ncbi:hypothetical protein [Planococcus sp. MB-3u-03]|uniref:hypothetical protein n=1 Tax=Planococcus sp. MB-3u-03 TaxID=2058136 RepID=UPI002FCD861B
MDKWGIDVVVTGSQKRSCCRQGSHSSQRASVHGRKSKPIRSRAFLDLKSTATISKRHNAVHAGDLHPLRLAASIEFIEEEGLENVYRRHRLMRDMTRAAFKALNVRLLTSDEDASPTVTAVYPEDFDAEKFRKVLKEEFAIEFAGGQQHLAKSIFRIGHMGYCSPAEVLQALAASEVVLKKLGQDITLGAGIAAAQQVFLEGKDK